MPAYDYDLIIIGAGVAGLHVPQCVLGLDASMAIIDHEHMGGASILTNTVQIDELIKAAAIAHTIQSAQRVGIKNDAHIDTSQVMSHVRATVKNMYADTCEHIKKRGIAFLQGAPVFLDYEHIQLGHTKLRYKKVIIATGSIPEIPTIDGIDSIAYLTSHTVFDVDVLPKSMIILGGTIVALQLAYALNRLGVSVTLIEQKNRILSLYDQEFSAVVEATMRNEGVIISCGIEPKKITHHDHGIKIVAMDGDNETCEFVAHTLLVATGRNPNVYTLGLQNADVHFDQHGIKVDAYLRTSNKNIFACGDVVFPLSFTKEIEYQAWVVAQNAYGSFWRKETYDNKKVEPYCLEEIFKAL